MSNISEKALKLENSESNVIAISNSEILKPTKQKLQLVALEEDEYFSQIENIIRRDYYPDLDKVQALKQFEKDKFTSGNNSVPSVLIQSTGRSKNSLHIPGASTQIRQMNSSSDPADELIVRRKIEGFHQNTTSEKSVKPILSLD